jgi:hypothetical protein
LGEREIIEGHSHIANNSTDVFLSLSAHLKNDSEYAHMLPTDNLRNAGIDPRWSVNTDTSHVKLQQIFSVVIDGE